MDGFDTTTVVVDGDGDRFEVLGRLRRDDDRPGVGDPGLDTETARPVVRGDHRPGRASSVGQAVTRASTEVNRPRPSADGPVSSLVACSGCGMRPTTLPAASVMPAMSRVEPLGADSA